MQRSLSIYLERYLEEKSIFRDRKVLLASYTPQELLHRDEQTQILGQILAPSLRLQKPSNVFLYGKTGTGKTVSVKYTLDQVMRIALERDIPLRVLYVNCKMQRTADTEYRLIAHIANQLGAKVPITGLPTTEVYKIFQEQLEKKEQLLILVLDEVDQLIRKADDTLLYSITRLNTTLKRSQITIIGITNDTRFTEDLDPRVRSSLGEEELIFPAYNAVQINDILKQREEQAFHDGVIDAGVVEKCAAYAARDHGDARRAIDLLRVAGELAERNGLKNVTEDHLDEAERKIERDRMLDIVRNQPKQFQVVVYSILTMGSKSKESIISTGEVYILYEKYCSMANLRPLTQRRVSDIIAELDMLGLITVRIISKGRYGRTREIKSAVPRDTAINIKKLLAGHLDLPL